MTYRPRTPAEGAPGIVHGVLGLVLALGIWGGFGMLLAAGLASCNDAARRDAARLEGRP